MCHTNFLSRRKFYLVIVVMASNISFGEKRYLVRIDGEVVGMIDTEMEAISTINSIAAAEDKRLSCSGCTILQRRLRDGREIRLLSQHSNSFRTYLRQETVIDIISAPRINHISPYADRIARYLAEKASKTSSQ